MRGLHFTTCVLGIEQGILIGEKLAVLPTYCWDSHIPFRVNAVQSYKSRRPSLVAKCVAKVVWPVHSSQLLFYFYSLQQLILFALLHSSSFHEVTITARVYRSAHHQCDISVAAVWAKVVCTLAVWPCWVQSTLLSINSWGWHAQDTTCVSLSLC